MRIVLANSIFESEECESSKYSLMDLPTLSVIAVSDSERPHDTLPFSLLAKEAGACPRSFGEGNKVERRGGGPEQSGCSLLEEMSVIPPLNGRCLNESPFTSKARKVLAPRYDL